jgi:hypothetical protein
VGFEPTVSAGERPQTYASDSAATGTGLRLHMKYIHFVLCQAVPQNLSSLPSSRYLLYRATRCAKESRSNCTSGVSRKQNSVEQNIKKALGQKLKPVEVYPPSPVSRPWPALCGIFRIPFIWQRHYWNYWRRSTAYVKWYTCEVKHCILRSTLKFKNILINSCWLIILSFSAWELFAWVQLVAQNMKIILYSIKDQF